MTNGRALLDTNIVIELCAHDPVIVQRIAEMPQVYLPSIVIGELYYGALCSQKPAKNTEQIALFARRATIIGCDDITAQEYASIKHQLRMKGKPIPENDLWIAAIARQYTCALATRDTHFEAIEGIYLLRW